MVGFVSLLFIAASDSEVVVPIIFASVDGSGVSPLTVVASVVEKPARSYNGIEPICSIGWSCYVECAGEGINVFVLHEATCDGAHYQTIQ